MQHLTDWCHLLSHCVTQEDWWAIHNYLAIIQEVFKRFFGWKKIQQQDFTKCLGMCLQIIVCSFVLFAMIFQTCYSIYIRYKFWCWLQSHLQQDLTILKLASWSSSNAIFLDWEVHISGQSNQTQLWRSSFQTVTERGRNFLPAW